MSANKQAIIDPYSAVSVPIEIRSNGNILGTATGFFTKKDDVWYLVSNWHVFSGRNVFTGQPIHGNCAIPDELRFTLYAKGNLKRLQDTGLSINNELGKANWIQHPNGQLFDVAAIRINDAPTEVSFFDALRQNEKDLLLVAGSDLFIVGFPLNLTKQGLLPVWKRGSVASEPEVLVDELPVILVDSATRQGMSGSPTYQRAMGIAVLSNGKIEHGNGPFTRFVGIYSGRHGTQDEMDVQLGRVFHRSVIEEVISNGIPGTYELCN